MELSSTDRLLPHLGEYVGTYTNRKYGLKFEPCDPAGTIARNEGLPMGGYFVDAEKHGLLTQRLDPVKLKKALEAGFTAIGSERPDIRRVTDLESKAIRMWVSSETLMEMRAYFEKPRTPDQKGNAYDDFGQAFAQSLGLLRAR